MSVQVFWLLSLRLCISCDLSKTPEAPLLFPDRDPMVGKDGTTTVPLRFRDADGTAAAEPMPQ